MSGFLPGEWGAYGDSGMNIARGESGGVPDDFWRRRMAASLMGGQNNQGAFGGLANAGAALGGAMALKSMQPDPLAGQKARMDAAGTPMGSGGMLGPLNRLFSLGGGA